MFFIELGQEVHIADGNFVEAINEGVRQGYKEGYLRKSIVDDPVIDRINTKDNTPAVIYTDSEVEKELLEKINKTGVGPMGLGGRVTALEVHIETYPCHIATMPVAINIQCHCCRHKKAII